MGLLLGLLCGFIIRWVYYLGLVLGLLVFLCVIGLFGLGLFSLSSLFYIYV